MPNVPVPIKLLLVSVRLQLVPEQKPADACPGAKTHSKPDIARVIASQRARAVASEGLFASRARCLAYPEKRCWSMVWIVAGKAGHPQPRPQP